MSSFTLTQDSQKFCNLLKLKYPIIQAPMAGGPCGVELVSTVSNSGALGSLGAGYMSSNALDEFLLNYSNSSDAPLHVNLMIIDEPIEKDINPEIQILLKKIAKDVGVKDYNLDFTFKNQIDEQIKILIKREVKIVSFTFGLPSKLQFNTLKESGAFLMATANSVREAQEIAEFGFDAIIVQSHSAGGHRGGLAKTQYANRIDLLPLIRGVKKTVNIPIVASGGIMDGYSIAATLVAGASAASLGTAFLVTKESAADEIWKKEILASKDTSTTLITTFSGKEARGIKNKFSEITKDMEDSFPTYPITNTLTKSIRAKAKEKLLSDYMSLWCGQGSFLSRDLDVKTLIHTLMDEMENAFKETMKFV